MSGDPRRAFCPVGPGWRFTSGIGYFVCQFANALADCHEISVIHLGHLLPRCLYPGAGRVGKPRARASYRPDLPVLDGINWWWGRSLVRALLFLAARRSEVLLLQWWTAAVLHTYLVLAVASLICGARVILELHELHELHDIAEEGLTLARWYGRWGLRALLRLSHDCAVHSAADQEVLNAAYDLRRISVAAVPHGPFDQYRPGPGLRPGSEAPAAAVQEAPKPGVVNLLFFGMIRPCKGPEDLLTAFNDLGPGEAAGLWLTVVGETCEGCTGPARLIESSPCRGRVTFVNDHVPEEVVAAAFGHADVVVLPYRRSASSCPLYVTMSLGLPVVETSVGGLPEAAAGSGGVFAPPGDPRALQAAIGRATALAGRRFADPRSLDDSIAALLLAVGPRLARPVPGFDDRQVRGEPARERKADRAYSH